MDKKLRVASCELGVGAAVVFAIALFTSILFTGCFGINSTIDIKKDGSGTISMEYKIANELLETGTLDGNEAYPAIPVGEADFKRSIARIDGLSLGSFNIKKETNDTIYRIKLKFKTIDALCKFMDAQGAGFSYGKTNGEETLTISLIPQKDEYSAEMKKLLPVVFEGDNFDLQINTPRKCAAAVYGENYQKIDSPPAGKFNASGRSFVFSSPMADLLSTSKPLTITLSW